MLLRDNGIVHPLMYVTTIIAIALMAFSNERAIQIAGAVLLIATVISPMVRSWRETPPTREAANRRSDQMKPHRPTSDKKL